MYVFKKYKKISIIIIIIIIISIAIYLYICFSCISDKKKLLKFKKNIKRRRKIKIALISYMFDEN